MDKQEQRMIERLRDEDRRWPVLKWFYAVLGAGMIGEGFYLFLYTIRSVREEPDLGSASALLFVPLIPLAWVLGVIFLRDALQKWSGDPMRQLLLKLVDKVAIQENESQRGVGR